MAASRAFVCIRPQTYEDAEEAKVLARVFSDRAGNLHNTSFGILSSDGEEKLSPSGRSPSMVYESAQEFESALREIAREQKTDGKKPIAHLPELPGLRIALDVAAADLRPLVVVYSDDEAERTRLCERLERLAWSEAFVGRLRYVILDDEQDLEGFESVGLEPGVSVVQAEAFGRSGAILAHAALRATARSLAEALSTGQKAFDAKAKNVRAHLREGKREGIEWESALPVSDPGGR